MNIFRFILIGLMVMLSLVVGSVNLLIYSGVIDFYPLSATSAQITYTLQIISGISLITIPSLFIMTLVIPLVTKCDFKFSQNLGEVIVSKKAILNFITKQISKKNFVKKIYPRVKISKDQSQCNLTLKVLIISGGSSIKELTSLLQQDVKEAVENIIGIKLLNIRIVVEEIDH